MRKRALMVAFWLGQFTTDGVVNLTFNFQWDNANSDTFNAEGISIVFPEVPVPGCTNLRLTTTILWLMKTTVLAPSLGASAQGLSYDVVAADPLGTGESTYRIYANFTSNDVEVTAMYGTDTEPWLLDGDAAFYQDPLGGDFGGAINRSSLRVSPTIEYDTWWTIGLQPGDSDGRQRFRSSVDLI